MTRRIIKCPRTFRGEWVAGFNIHRRHSDKKIVDWPCMYDADEREFDMGEILPKYKLGDVVAIAQSSKDVDRFHRKGKNADYLEYLDSILPELKLYPGWGNKMFVKADLMPHHIKITGIKVERLQDISDEDCLKEGIIHVSTFLGQKNISYPTCKRILLVNERSPRSFCLLDRQSIRQRYMGRKPICVGV